MRLMNVIDGPSSGTDSSAAAKARRASSQCRARLGGKSFRVVVPQLDLNRT
jgi:hypothetical protein